MLALGVFAVSGIIRDNEIGTGVSWTLLLFLGGVFSLANVVQEYKITDWLASYMVPIAKQLTFSVLAVVVLVAVATLVLRFLDPTGFITIPVLFLPVVDVTSAAGIPPLLLVAPILIAAVPFWASYQNIWVAMGEGITENEAFSSWQRLRLAHAYAVAALIAIAVAVGYWKMIRVLPG